MCHVIEASLVYCHVEAIVNSWNVFLLSHLNAMQEIFQLIVMAIGNLSSESGSYYDKAIQILDNVAKVRSCLLMLDLDCDSLLVDMFQQFLRSIRYSAHR